MILFRRVWGLIKKSSSIPESMAAMIYESACYTPEHINYLPDKQPG